MKITRKESTHFADAPITQQQTASLQCEKKNSKETKGSMCAFFNERQKMVSCTKLLEKLLSAQ